MNFERLGVDLLPPPISLPHKSLALVFDWIDNNNSRCCCKTIMVEDEADAAAGSTKAMKDKEAKKKPVTTTIISKRQKTKHADQGKNVWPQFPKLQGVERREKAHLRASGLSGGGNNKKKAKADHDNDDTTMMLFQHLGRALGGPDAIVRHQAVLQLETYLKARCEATGLSELDLLKISKCLWYTLYLADRQVTSTT
jgi:Nucleolar protein,Nop52